MHDFDFNHKSCAKVAKLKDALDKMPKARHGWRYFLCECGKHWRETTRDVHSPSIETCPKCLDEVDPYMNEVDLDLSVSSSGNILQHKREDVPNEVAP